MSILNDLTERRKHSPLVQARAIAFQIMTTHVDCLRDGVPLDDMSEDIAQAILGGVVCSDTTPPRKEQT